MAGSDSLHILRAAIAANAKLELVSSEDGPETDFKEAAFLRIAPQDPSSVSTVLDLSLETQFESQIPEPKFVDLRTVYNTWLTRDASIADYIQAAEDLGITNLKFVERTDLINWLDGSSSESDYIHVAESTEVGTTAAAPNLEEGGEPAEIILGPVKKRPISEELRLINSRERTLADHNTELRGFKLVDFSSVSKDCSRLIMQEYKSKVSWFSNKANGGPSRPSSSGSNGAPSGLVQTGRNKEPIILLSSSPSSLLNMANIKDFLESGVFEPVLRSSSSPNLLRITRNSNVLGAVKFVVVDNVEKFKAEYWDRVVAVFVTGQSWQLKPYKWSDPHTLFQHVRGFSLVYKGDPVPPLVTQWHVQVESIDRNQRFKDREVVEHIWEKLESSMVARGWPVKRQ